MVARDELVTKGRSHWRLRGGNFELLALWHGYGLIGSLSCNIDIRGWIPTGNIPCSCYSKIGWRSDRRCMVEVLSAEVSVPLVQRPKLNSII